MPKIKEKFGHNWADIASRLVAVHGTIERAANAAGVAKSTLQRWKNGSRAPRSQNEAARVIAGLERLEGSVNGGGGFMVKITCRNCGHEGCLDG